MTQIVGPNGRAINVENVRTLRGLLALAEQGELTTLVTFGFATDGRLIQGSHIEPSHLAVLFTLLHSLATKVMAKLIALEVPGVASGIQAAQNMPGEAG